MGPWAHDAHMPQEYVYKLRDLIDTCIPKELSYTRDTRIVPNGLVGVGSIILMHRAKLITPESPAEETNAFLFKKDGTP